MKKSKRGIRKKNRQIETKREKTQSEGEKLFDDTWGILEKLKVLVRRLVCLYVMFLEIIYRNEAQEIRKETLTGKFINEMELHGSFRTDVRFLC